jgi:CHAT domain-containing protein/Flp pilus assembly protein TadD
MHRWLLLITCLLLAYPIIAQKSKGASYYDQAKEALNEGDSKKALELMSNARKEYLKEKNYHRFFVATQSIVIIYQDGGLFTEAENLIAETIPLIPTNSNDNLVLQAKLQDNLAYGYLYGLNRVDDAIKAYDRSIQYFEQAGYSDRSDLAFELVNRGASYHSIKEVRKAIADFSRASMIYSKDASTKASTLADVHNTLGVLWSELEEWSASREQYDRGLKLISAEEQPELVSKLLNGLGIIAYNLEDYTQAYDLFERERNLQLQVMEKGDARYAATLINLGNAQKKLGNVDEALRDYQEALAIYTRNPPEQSTDLIDLMLNFSILANDLGLFAQASQLHDAALTLSKTSYGANSLSEAFVLMSMAATSFANGAFEQSLIQNSKALSIMSKFPDAPSGDMAQLYNNIGQAYDEMGDVDLALQHKQRALELYKRVYGTEHTTHAMVLGNIGLSYEAAGQYDKALDYLKQALDIRIKLQGRSHKEVGTLYLNMGMISILQGDARGSLAYLENARQIYDGAGKGVVKAMIYNRLGYSYTIMKENGKAEQSFQSAWVANSPSFNNMQFSVSVDHPDFISQYEMLVTCLGKADLLMIRGDRSSLDHAVRLLRTSDELLINHSSQLKNNNDRLGFSRINAVFTQQGIQTAGKLYDLTRDAKYLEDMYYYAERSKANLLYTELQRNHPSALANVPPTLWSQRAALSAKLTTVRQGIATAYTNNNQALVTQLRSTEFTVEKELTELETSLQEKMPKGKSLSKNLPNWKAVQKTLAPGTALVSYTITDSVKSILIGTSQGLTVRYLPNSIDVEKLVRGFTNAIKFQSPELPQLTERMTTLFWLPAESAVQTLGGANRIIIVPEGPLNYLPFEALGSGSYLIEKYTLYYAFSGALLTVAPWKEKSSKPTLLAMAPVFSDHRTNVLTASSERFVKMGKTAEPASRAFSLQGDYIEPLPGTEREVEQINQLHADKGIFSKYFINEFASEELIKQGEFAKYDYIHLATHGFVNGQYPELSGLLLTQDSASAEDGILYSGEILGLSIHADLVTLSACETALGKKIEGEGVRGLSSAFLMAGASNVIASLWKVADESTASLMVAFYTELLNGKDKATALRDAKLSLLHSDRYRHPYYWAPFIQIGRN